jgi:hypothetical protein
MTRLLAAAAIVVVLVGVLYLAFGTGRSVITYTPDAVGQTGTLYVVADSATWNGPVGDAIRDELGRGLATLPQPEPAFTLIRQDLTEQFFNQLRRQHAVLFAGPYTRPSTTGRFLRARLDSSGVAALERGGNGVFLRPNLWATRQLVVYATGPDDETVAAQIRARGSELRRAFDALARQRLTRDMFERARQTDIEDRLLERHGFAVGVQHDYVLVRDTTFVTDAGTAGTFVRLRRLAASDSWRDLFIYFEEDPRLERLNREAVLALREDLSRRFVRGADDSTYIRVEDRFPDRRPIVTDTVGLNGRFALETRGTWYLGREDGRSAGMGGPFVNYAFYDDDTGRFYMIDGMVFAPRFDKREFLRQMEAIAHTFRTRDDDFAVTGERLAEAD